MERGEQRRMKILVVNDDGFEAEGIRQLAQAACSLGEVYVVAPERECSAMSHSLSVRREMALRRRAFPAAGVKEAYSLSGTPADCVKVGIHVVLKGLPDLVLSGVNYGYNCGFDIAYSATVAAAIEARMNGIPAIALSRQRNGVTEVCDHYLPTVLKSLLEERLAPGEIWNVNFPGCPLSECMGILLERRVAQDFIFKDAYDVADKGEGLMLVTEAGEMLPEGPERDESDLWALHNGWVSVGRVRGTVLL